MLRFRFSSIAAFLTLLGTGLLTWSCGPDPLVGRVVLSGSSTLAPLAVKALGPWEKLHPRVEARVEAIGSDAGLERLIRYKDADLALVSRPLTETDHEAARSAGMTLLSLPLAWDAVCLVVPVTNTWAQSLTKEQAAQAFTTASRWSDFSPSWPDRPINRFILGPNSGTIDVFASAVLHEPKATLYNIPGAQSSEDDKILARGIARVPSALGILGWTTYQEAGLTLRAVALDGVLPTEETIRDKTYGLPRALWLVVTREGWQAKPAVASLVRYLYDHYAVLTEGTGLVSLSSDELDEVGKLLP